ncbi:hypothetical protein [Thermus tengchongensis]|uniref:Uncharacterized protein n=1 Tax=Thermus tengchongensis TaxID=1214928 RepID=A0ABY2K7S2_9DEIN|nr:hypothetical protein [Thermus tengchongensis]TFU14687.1 hypothetical protein E0489_11745 [Thermus tengchongensis]
MRLDRVNLRAVSDILRAMVQEALMEPGKVVRMALPTSPADGVQVFVRAGQEGVFLAIRRPGGKEDPREVVALAQAMGLVIQGEPYHAKGKQMRPGFLGRRSYLVARCRLDPAVWEGRSEDGQAA